MLERLRNQADSMRERLEDVSRDRAALRQEVVMLLGKKSSFHQIIEISPDLARQKDKSSRSGSQCYVMLCFEVLCRPGLRSAPHESRQIQNGTSLCAASLLSEVTIQVIFVTYCIHLRHLLHGA